MDVMGSSGSWIGGELFLSEWAPFEGFLGRTYFSLCCRIGSLLENSQETAAAV